MAIFGTHSHSSVSAFSYMLGNVCLTYFIKITGTTNLFESQTEFNNIKFSYNSAAVLTGGFSSSFGRGLTIPALPKGLVMSLRWKEALVPELTSRVSAW